jgi:hypothetical protein
MAIRDGGILPFKNIMPGMITASLMISVLLHGLLSIAKDV